MTSNLLFRRGEFRTNSQKWDSAIKNRMDQLVPDQYDVVSSSPAQRRHVETVTLFKTDVRPTGQSYDYITTRYYTTNISAPRTTSPDKSSPSRPWYFIGPKSEKDQPDKKSSKKHDQRVTIKDKSKGKSSRSAVPHKTHHHHHHHRSHHGGDEAPLKTAESTGKNHHHHHHHHHHADSGHRHHGKHHHHHHHHDGHQKSPNADDGEKGEKIKTKATGHKSTSKKKKEAGCCDWIDRRVKEKKLAKEKEERDKKLREAAPATPKQLSPEGKDHSSEDQQNADSEAEDKKVSDEPTDLGDAEPDQDEEKPETKSAQSYEEAEPEENEKSSKRNDEEVKEASKQPSVFQRIRQSFRSKDASRRNAYNDSPFWKGDPPEANVLCREEPAYCDYVLENPSTIIDASENDAASEKCVEPTVEKLEVDQETAKEPESEDIASEVRIVIDSEETSV